jgi:hypothetical protein
MVMLTMLTMLMMLMMLMMAAASAPITLTHRPALPAGYPSLSQTSLSAAAAAPPACFAFYQTSQPTPTPNFIAGFSC